MSVNVCELDPLNDVAGLLPVPVRVATTDHPVAVAGEYVTVTSGVFVWKYTLLEFVVPVTVVPILPYISVKLMVNTILPVESEPVMVRDACQ